MKLFNNQNNAQFTISERNSLAIVGLLIVVYTVVFSYASIRRWESYQGTLFDLGIMIQTWYNTSHGRLLAESVNLGILSSRFWHAHWEFIYIPLSIFYKLAPRPETLLILQSLFLAMGALPVYLLAKDRLHNQATAVVFATSYLLYPAMQNTNLFDVHGIVFSTSLILYAFYFLEKKRINWFLFFAFLALLCREDLAVVWGMTGIYIAIFRKQVKLGICLAVVSTVWFGVFYFGRPIMISYLNPALSEATNAITKPSHWAYLKGGKLLLENPIYFLDEHFLTKLNAKYLIWLFAPLGFISLASPSTLAIASPILLINLTSDWYPAHVIDYPYTATLTPIVFISAIYGLNNMLKKIQERGLPKYKIYRLRKILLTMVLLSSVVIGVTKSNIRKINEWDRTPHHEAIDRVASKIPENASLTVDTILGSRTAERRELYIFPDNIDSVDFILYDFGNREFRLMTRTSFFLPPAKPINPNIWHVLNNPNYGVSHYEDGVVLFQRGYDYEAGVRNLAIAKHDEIQNLVEIAVNDTLIFHGYSKHADTRFWDTFYYHFTLYWMIKEPSTQDINGYFLLSNGDSSFLSQSKAAFGLYPLSKWKVGEIIREEVYWEKRPGFKPGNIMVSLKYCDDKRAVRLFEF